MVSHVILGIKENENADVHAYSVSIEVDPSVDRGNTIHVLKFLRHTTGFNVMGETMALLKMRHTGVKQKVVRLDGYFAGNKKLVNQHQTGVTSHDRLINIS